MVGIIKNAKDEGPGTIEDFLIENCIPYRIFESHKGEFPTNIEEYNSLIIMGGPMSVYEMGKYPFLKIEAGIIEKAINKNIKVLGICLGAQMIAHVLGAKVYKGNVEEIGWHKIEITEDGLKDNLIISLSKNLSGNICRKFNVFHWHGDTFDLPSGTIHLAKSYLYENQAFKFKNNVYAFQFHIEINKKLLYMWFDFHKLKEEILKKYEEIKSEYLKRSKNFYKSFFAV